MRKAKSKSAQDVLDRLNAFLNAAEPEPVYWLTRLWEDQQQAVTYKELREAIERGYMDEKTLLAWQADYTRFVNDKLRPLWTGAMNAGTARLMAEHPDFFFDPMDAGVRSWMAVHGSEWVTLIGAEQRKAINAMIGHAAAGAWSVDELARAIRPTVGLNAPQAAANLRFYENVKASLLKNNPHMREATAAKQARDAAGKYAARQHRARGYTIATTELAFAYNKGCDEGVKQAIRQGYMGRTVRVWSTAGDGGVCPVCEGLDGMEAGMEEEFDFPGKFLYSGHRETPPAHPRCRCAVEYREIEPPAWQTAGGTGAASGPLQRERGGGILPSEPVLGKQGDTDGYTVITKVEAFDFGDPQAAARKLEEFAAAYRTAGTEHALVLSPQNLAFELKGVPVSVNTRLVGKDGIRGGIVIHNHPPGEDGFAGAFSRDDFRELFWGEPAESWLVAGAHTYRMRYSGPPITPAEAVERYKQAFRAVLQKAWETQIPIEAEQLEIMQWLKEHMEGVDFDEL